MANPMYPPRLEPDQREKELQQDLSDCVLKSSWIFTCRTFFFASTTLVSGLVLTMYQCLLAVGLGLAIPLGIRTKSYVPLVTFGGGGTLLDMMAGVYKCGAQRKELRDYHSERLLAEGSTIDFVQEQQGRSDA
eukprot:jgi/Botrbrau1/2983/Bobra.0026s0045.1